MDGIREGIGLWESLRTVGLAAALGALIGLEREWAGKPAGLRTHILVAVAAALFVVLGFSAVDTFRDQDLPGVRTDPIRILQAIVIGVSFLGAGTIVRDGRGEVEGLTTAASVLLTASLGVAVALGHTALAMILTVAIVGVLWLLWLVESWLRRRAEALPERPPGSKAGGRADVSALGTQGDAQRE